MAYRDLPFPPGTPVFPDQRLSFSSLPLDFPAEPRAETVLEYLQSYSTTFNLLPHIRFNTRVDRLHHTASPGRRWTIESSTSSSPTSEEFDYVCVANGHYSDVWLPSVPGLRYVPPDERANC